MDKINVSQIGQLRPKNLKVDFRITGARFVGIIVERTYGVLIWDDKSETKVFWNVFGECLMDGHICPDYNLITETNG